MSKTRGDEKLLTTPTIRSRQHLNCKVIPPSLLCLLKSKGSRDAPSYLQLGLHQSQRTTEAGPLAEDPPFLSTWRACLWYGDIPGSPG